MHASQLWSEFLQESEGDYPGPTIEQIDAAEFRNTEECRHSYDPSEVMNFERDEDGKLVLRFRPQVERGSGDFNTRLRNRRLAMENTSSTSLPNPQHNDGNTSSTKRISFERHPSAPSVERPTSTEHSDEDMSEGTGDDSDEDIMEEMQRATEQHRNSSVDDEFASAIERSRASYREEKELQEALHVSSRSAQPSVDHLRKGRSKISTSDRVQDIGEHIQVSEQYLDRSDDELARAIELSRASHENEKQLQEALRRSLL
ncbi:hypothetical protein BKA61DRAFT_676431 [Leptodontidium sp. MPI-SDFR-AT-0119]|nr:hypothetical protein BKA61DRAFT_676431 [Leptodontidium sp. MPI-SDFR-AT-0119]